MEIPGIASILNQPASVVWKSEQPAQPEVVRLFEQAEHALELERFPETADSVTQIAHYQLQPSQEMRLCHLQGRLCSDSYDYDQAHEFYRMALDIATDHADLDSQILLTMMAGEVRYGKTRFQEALLYYREALNLWSLRAQQIADPPIEPEVTILEYMGTPLWLIGDFDEARTTLARAVTLALYRSGGRRSEYLRRVAAGAIWTLMLSFRSQSDMLDGDANYLRTALRRSRTGINLFRSIGTPDVNMARFYIQVAEIYLDLAELHLLREAQEAALAARKQALNFVTSAFELLRLTTDVWANMLANLTLLRYDIQGQTELEAAYTIRDIESRLIAIEREAAEVKDNVISAKAATLRAEWLMSLGDYAHARESLILALQGFHSNGMGMATRAQRLLRRITSGRPTPRFARRSRLGHLQRNP